MKKWMPLYILTLLITLYIPSPAVESGNCRLLSISESEKVILVSQIPSKTKYLLDASSAKITINGKPAEFKQLKVFSIVQVKMNIRKSSKNGVTFDGLATEIRILDAETPNTNN
jgi:hypothetical protein